MLTKIWDPLKQIFVWWWKKLYLLLFCSLFFVHLRRWTKKSINLFKYMFSIIFAQKLIIIWHFLLLIVNWSFSNSIDLFFAKNTTIILYEQDQFFSCFCLFHDAVSFSPFSHFHVKKCIAAFIVFLYFIVPMRFISEEWLFKILWFIWNLICTFQICMWLDQSCGTSNLVNILLDNLSH